MPNKISYLQRIVKAYEHRECTDSLTELFNQMNRSGMDSQFILFMRECLTRRESLELLSVLQEFLSIDDYQNSDKNKMISDKTLQSLLDNIAAEMDYSDKTKGFEIRVFFDNTLKHQVALSYDDKFHVIKNILPGMYIIKLSTGRTLWEKYITSTHVLLAPFAEQTEFKLAAKTTLGGRKPTVEDIIIQKIQVRVFAGIKNGTMEVQFYE